MKYIQKKGCPQYTNWCESVVGTFEEKYSEVKGDNKKVLFETLLKEQGFICGYTMKRIDKDTAHIEHIKPQNICRAERRGKDLDYTNLIACYPRDDMTPEYRYGARHKNGWWDDDGEKFVSPLKPECEKIFRFDWRGNITAVNEAAAKTIAVLALNHGSLTEDRGRVIGEFLFGKDRKDPLSPAQVTRAISKICDQDGEGRYYEFCIAIRDALIQFRDLREMDRRSRR